MSQFDAKTFNAEAFGRYVERIPNLKRNELLKSGVLNVRNDLKAMLTEQTGGNYITIPMKGLLDGEAQNYDGATNITATGTKTFTQSMVVVGRAKAWTEKDFSFDITGEDFMDNVAAQVASYWEAVDQDTLLAILAGIFSMTGAGNVDFAEGHTLDISDADISKDPEAQKIGATGLNKAIQKASGDNKGAFTMAIMHSEVATNLENLNLLSYLKYTDEAGITRDIGIATLNGKAVLIDDSMPVEDGVYTTYVLGKGAFEYCNCGAKVPYEMARDAAKNGGEDTLFTRQRKLFAPKGISFTKKAMASLSPTKAELENGSNWELVNDGNPDGKTYINHKSIAIARIQSRG